MGASHGAGSRTVAPEPPFEAAGGHLAPFVEEAAEEKSQRRGGDRVGWRGRGDAGTGGPGNRSDCPTDAGWGRNAGSSFRGSSRVAPRSTSSASWEGSRRRGEADSLVEELREGMREGGLCQGCYSPAEVETHDELQKAISRLESEVQVQGGRGGDEEEDDGAGVFGRGMQGAKKRGVRAPALLASEEAGLGKLMGESLSDMVKREMLASEERIHFHNELSAAPTRPNSAFAR